MSDDLRESAQRKLSFFQTMKAVAWGFFGVRKGAGYREDSARLNPVHVIVAGLLAAAIFVAVLVLIVRWAVSSLT
ncbi:DUF2970 domain-containing protein [Achromobacter xylosoxidans]|jgi:hypothetical protein|uniref:DUF2970 domain-containing protein n=1 Tax=Achromobacter pulmonis TaxID=1389932 RepID=A0A6S7DAC1_9BURK|nr:MULTISPECIES: DUF2970 domain-containing protein [Achromobacter]MPT27111.1 DUF2970 domain-containing protein [Achromobacter sp.]AHC44699.1 putative membrane protein [Achromobacter xylosoxidans NBRC 15126 = ATCC 27061]AMH05706.1 DUF2970 domain-containing protein [Achromobacter xylosoxidans]AXA75209.1 DUF2970 domain-containing protein [Achromobacter xylosoxidans]EFV83675.1 hypothetical protein HMPREF0005_03443 [Achromobacter xylosoxidans C54]